MGEVIYVVVQDGVVSRYLSGGGAADGFDYNFAVGPEIVLPWLTRMWHWREDEWLADDSCSAGILIDVDRRQLLFFTTLDHIAAENRFGYHLGLLEAYARTWSDWTVRWAYDGLGDLFGHLALDSAAVRRDWSDETLYSPWVAAGDPVGFAVSVASHDSCRTYALSYNCAAPWQFGPSVVAQLRGTDQVHEWPTVPPAGLHLDMVRQRAGVWGIEPLEGLAVRWPTLWPGWQLELWGSDYQRHIEACGGALTLPPIDLPASLRYVAERVDLCWPVEERLRARGVDPESLHAMYAPGGFRHPQLDVGVTTDQLAAVCALIADKRP